MEKNTIKQLKNPVVIVEGYTDVQKIKKIFPSIECIKTDGLNIKSETINLIKKISENNEIIILTDPDGPGLKIREKLNEILSFKCKNAFVDKSTIKGKKIGVAEATDEEILNSLENLLVFDNKTFSIEWSNFIKFDLHLKKNRIKISKSFNWSEKINTKTLFKWINYVNLKIEDLLKILED